MEIIDGKYRVIKEIGKGGTGTVFLADHVNLGQKVVLKRIIGLHNSQKVNRIEVDILKNLQHPHLPRIYDFVNQGDYVYSVMEFIPGKSLAELKEEQYPFREKEILRWTKELCETLSYLHGQKPAVLHCDIKPQNIMLSDSGRIYLIDFNVSSYISGDNTHYGYTRKFASPEQIRIFMLQKESQQVSQEEKPETELTDMEVTEAEVLSDKNSVQGHLRSEKENTQILDGRTDIYSLGGTVYYLLTGEYPNQDKRCPARKYKISRKFAKIIDKSLEPDRNRRYASADDMLEDLLKINRAKSTYAVCFLFFIIVSLLVAGCLLTRRQENEGKDALAEEYFMDGDYEKALLLYQEYAENENVSEYYHIKAADCYVRIGSLDKALEYMEQAYSADPKDSYRNIILGYLEEKCERADSREEEIALEEKRVEMGENSPDTYLDLLNYYSAIADYDKVREYVEKAQTDGIGESVEKYEEMLEAIDQMKSIMHDLYVACEDCDESALYDLCLNGDFFKTTRMLGQPLFYKEDDIPMLGIYNNGFLYFGEIDDGVRQGQGRWINVSAHEFFVFQGTWENDLPNGQGEFYRSGYAQDNIPFMEQYQSNIINGLLDGECRMEYSDFYGWDMETSDSYTYTNSMGIPQEADIIPAGAYEVLGIPDKYVIVHFDMLTGMCHAQPKYELACVWGLGLEGE